MRFQVLGDMEIVVDDRVVSLPSRRQGQLLALLICAEGRPVPADRLADVLWGGRPGSQSGKNLQVIVHRLRRTLDDPGRIQYGRSGYSLVAQPAEVDSWEFAALVERAGQALGRRDGHRDSRRDSRRDTEEAAVLLERALALWRGRAFTGLDDLAPLAEEAERLEQQRRWALTERIDADMALGRHARVVHELVAMVDENPLAEPAVARLMAALHHTGQRTDALELYRRTRAALVGELGLEPGPQLRALHQAILRGDREIGPAVPGRETAHAPHAPPGTAPCLLPPQLGDLTGRDEELRLIAAVLRERSPTGPARCAISGMPGTGKTALAVQAAHEARDHFPDGQLYVNLHGGTARPVDPSHALGRFLRALGMPATAIPDGLDERAEAFRVRLSGRRVLVVLDDAADEAQVEPLLPAGSGCAVLVTSRAALTALPGTHRIALGVLGDAAAVDLLNVISGRTGDDADIPATERLAALCGRLPLALRIAGARLAARPHWSVERLVARLAGEHDRLDELTHGSLSVRASLALGYSGLAGPSRALLRRLGLLETQDFAGWVAAALLDAAPRDAEDVLEGLVEARLVEYAGLDSIGEPRYRLHDLVRLHARERGAAEDPPEVAGAALSRLAGGYLRLAEQAHRLQYGGDYTVLHGKGTRWDCGPAAVRRLLADPAGWLRSERAGLVAAVRHAARLGLSETCWDLAMTAVTLFEAQGLFDDWRSTSETALATAREAGDARGEAAMRYSLGTLAVFRQRYAGARPHFDAALRLFEQVGDRHGQALTIRNAALIERVEGRGEDALAGYERALSMLREVGDRHAEAHVLGSIAQIHIEHDRTGEAGPLLETALAVYRELGDLRGTAQILNRMGALLLREERAAAAEAAYRQVGAAARAAGDRIGEAHALLGGGEARLLAGNLDGAAELLESALRLATDVGEPFVAARARLTTGRLAALRDDLPLAASLLGRAAEAFEEIGLPLWHDRATRALRDLDGTKGPARPPG
ncbi:AfsR/SARP family transcriptional regulator [Microbispora amethystogenes]|uniref:AfsR/SARP family transcriptional regulator n=1 Tax=Microbispora amethystogenes TaxID=1427754 RepID=UPI001953F370|nr:AfsR/SARP family transcriptional regulator [Microbispora amethystogenes]